MKDTIAILNRNENSPIRNEKAAAIDLGMYNLGTYADTDGNAFIIPSLPYALILSKEGSGLDELKEVKKKLGEEAERIAKTCCQNDISVLYVGCCSGKLYILYQVVPKMLEPVRDYSLHAIFLEMLKKACDKYHIKLYTKEVNEAYTSQACALINDTMPYEKGKVKYKGERCGRTYYLWKKCVEVHADVNGALNILRKEGHSINIYQDSTVLNYITITYSDGKPIELLYSDYAKESIIHDNSVGRLSASTKQRSVYIDVDGNNDSVCAIDGDWNKGIGRIFFGSLKGLYKKVQSNKGYDNLSKFFASKIASALVSELQTWGYKDFFVRFNYKSIMKKLSTRKLEEKHIDYIKAFIDTLHDCIIAECKSEGLDCETYIKAVAHH